MKMTKLIEEAKNRANIASDYALAKVLGVPNGWISEYKATPAKRHPSVEVATKLAILAGRAEMEVIAEIELQTAKTEEKKKFWKQYIESRGITATVCMTALAASLMMTPEPANARVLQLQDYDAGKSDFLQTGIYIMRTRLQHNRLILRAVFDKWFQLINPYHPAHNYKFS